MEKLFKDSDVCYVLIYLIGVPVSRFDFSHIAWGLFKNLEKYPFFFAPVPLISYMTENAIFFLLGSYAIHMFVLCIT